MKSFMKGIRKRLPTMLLLGRTPVCCAIDWEYTAVAGSVSRPQYLTQSKFSSFFDQVSTVRLIFFI